MSAATDWPIEAMALAHTCACACDAARERFPPGSPPHEAWWMLMMEAKLLSGKIRARLELERRAKSEEDGR